MKTTLFVVERILFLLKFVGYVYLSILVYANFIGAKEVAYLLDVKQITDEGVKMGALVLSKQLIVVTIGVGILEALGNLVALCKPE